MLSERELALLAQIEEHLRAEEPALARLLATGSGPPVLRGLLAVAATMLLGAGIATIGGIIGNAVMLALGLTVAIVLPLPAWLAGSSRRVTGPAARSQPA